MTIGRAAADQAGARPYLHHGGPELEPPWCDGTRSLLIRGKTSDG